MTGERCGELAPQ